MSFIQSGQNQLTPITVTSVHINTQQTVVQITEDRLRLVLIEHLAKAEVRKRWHVPLGVLLALIPVILTSEFKDTGFVDKATWKAFFMFSTLAAGGWLVATLRGAFTSTSIEQLIQKIKNVSQP